MSTGLKVITVKKGHTIIWVVMLLMVSCSENNSKYRVLKGKGLSCELSKLTIREKMVKSSTTTVVDGEFFSFACITHQKSIGSRFRRIIPVKRFRISNGLIETRDFGVIRTTFHGKKNPEIVEGGVQFPRPRVATVRPRFYMTDRQVSKIKEYVQEK